MQASDYDFDGISIAPNALRHVGGTIRDRLGRDVTDLSLGAHAIANDPAHKVDGHPLAAAGTLPPLELVVGEQPATVDLGSAFQGVAAVYSAVSSNPAAATVAVAGAALTVSPVMEGTATVRVTARNATEMAILSFVVRVVTDPAEVRVLEHTLAAVGRSLLASVTMTVEGWFTAAPGVATITVAGRRLPVGTGEAGSWVGPGGGRGGRLTGDDLLRGSHFLLALDAGQADGAANEAGGAGVRLTVWGSYDGDLRTGHVGVDVGGERWLAGAVMSRSAGRTDYRFSGATTGSGRVATTLTSVQPYLRWTPRRGTAVWTILGAGGGSVENVRAHVGDRREESALSMRLGVVGGRQTLASVGRVELGLRGEVGVLRLDTGGGEEVIDGLGATVRRYRVGWRRRTRPGGRAARR